MACTIYLNHKLAAAVCSVEITVSLNVITNNDSNNVCCALCRSQYTIDRTAHRLPPGCPVVGVPCMLYTCHITFLYCSCPLHITRVFRLLEGCSWDLCCSGVLCSVTKRLLPKCTRKKSSFYTEVWISQSTRWFNQISPYTSYLCVICTCICFSVC
jgi:hypothetical protein